MLLCMDSYGVIRALGRSWDWQWTPVLDTSLLKSKSGGSLTDVYWPVSVMDDKLMCLVLSDGRRVPTASRKAAQSLQSVSLQMPFMGLDQPVNKHEEQHARQSLLWFNAEGGLSTVSHFYSSKQEVEQDKLVLALFQRASKGDFLARALDLATMLYKRKSLEVAIQMAEFEKKEALVARLRMLLAVKFPKVRPGAELDEAGISGFIDLDSSSSSSGAAAAASGPKRKLQRPAVSFEEAAEQNARGDEEDEGEAEYAPTALGAAGKSSLKRKAGDLAPSSSPPASNPFSSGSLALKAGQKVQSANVTHKAKPSSASSTAGTQPPPSPKKGNPFANK